MVLRFIRVIIRRRGGSFTFILMRAWRFFPMVIRRTWTSRGRITLCRVTSVRLLRRWMILIFRTYATRLIIYIIPIVRYRILVLSIRSTPLLPSVRRIMFRGKLIWFRWFRRLIMVVTLLLLFFVREVRSRTRREHGTTGLRFSGNLIIWLILI